MSRIHVFADEAGNFDFSNRQGASRYFILTTVQMEDCTIGDELAALRRQLAWEGKELLRDGFHATEDLQVVRDRVYAVLQAHEFRIDTTILEKAKTHPRVSADPTYFYQLAWYLHFKHVSLSIPQTEELLVIAAFIKTAKQREAAHKAIRDVVCQVRPNSKFETAFWHAAIDTCLQVVDYCSWAIQRKWERGDKRSYELIKNKLHSEFAAFAMGPGRYY